MTAQLLFLKTLMHPNIMVIVYKSLGLFPNFIKPHKGPRAILYGWGSKLSLLWLVSYTDHTHMWFLK